MEEDNIIECKLGSEPSLFDCLQGILSEARKNGLIVSANVTENVTELLNLLDEIKVFTECEAVIFATTKLRQ